MHIQINVNYLSSVLIYRSQICASQYSAQRTINKANLMRLPVTLNEQKMQRNVRK